MEGKISNTLPKYRFQLFNPDTNELLTLKTAPIEWKEGVIEIKRDIKVGGVFTSFIVSSLTFIKEGRDFLNKIWIEKEFNGQCELIVSWFRTSTRTYQEMPTRFGLNFATAKPRVKVGKFAIGFLIDAQKSSILVKLENRRNKEVDITKIDLITWTSNSLGGFPIKNTDWNIPKRIYFPEITQSYQTEWVAGYPVEANFKIENNENYNVYTQFEMNFRANEFSEAVFVPYLTNITDKNSIVKCFTDSLETRNLTINYDVIIHVTNRKLKNTVYAVEIEIMNGNTVISTNRILDCGSHLGYPRATGSLSITLAAGQSIRIYVKSDDVKNIAANLAYSYFRITQDVAEYAEKYLDSMPIYEAFEKVLQHDLDLQLPFYSDFFGRTDTPYNLTGDVYPSENQLSFANIMTGLHLRGAQLFYDENSTFPITFDKLFKSANSIWNLGYCEEFIDGFNRIRIEPYGWFFDNTQALDLSDRISIYDIETEAMPELAYSQIKSGFKDFSYEKINGRSEFNTEHTYSTELNTDSVLDIVSDIRGDTKGIIEKILMPLDTEDSKEDNELFIIKTQRYPVDSWTPEKQENVQVVNDTALFGTDTMNLYFTPLRMLLRHGNKIKGSLMKVLSSFVRFQTADKLQNLETTDDGIVVLKENQDYLVDNLNDGIFKPIKHTVTCKFTFADFDNVMANKKGYIKFSSNIKGYLLSLKKKNDEDKATIEIIEMIEVLGD